jgi:type I restriction-modification system DNA methylase subunit
MDIELLKKNLTKKIQDFDSKDHSGESERDICRAYIEPLFDYLGWHMKDTDEVKEQKNEPEGRPDYIFYLNGSIAFFLETKKVKEINEEDIKQALNYGRSRNKRWSILSNFQETIILICDTKETSLSNHIFRRISYKDMITSLDTLLLLSRESFETGAIETKAQNEGRIKKTIRIDEELLNDILLWRKNLIASIKKNNRKDYSKETLEEIAQILLNRIIFIRTAEDRRIEARPDETIKSILNQYEKNKYVSIKDKINRLFEEYDKIYDSKLFTYDELNFDNRHESEKVHIDNKVYYKILKETCEKNNIYAYKFGDIDADILGDMYERYIGNIQEFRKKQGIYYTPIWVVNYIVNNSIGYEFENKKQKEIPKLRILDISCGSGSFLLKAFDAFDEYYKANREKYFQTSFDFDNATSKITQKILREHIFGVDLDIKAVEIAQLNLLLKIAETKHRLPDLRNNIKQGNSLVDDKLVDPDFAFKWESSFKEIMDNGKFNIIIGNPPYSFTRDADFTKLVKEYANDKYFKGLDSISKSHARQSGKINLYSLFLIKGIQLLADDGILGFIIPNNLLRTTTYDIIRKYILENCKILQIVDLGAGVFKNATVSTSIIILQRELNSVARNRNKVSIIYDVDGELSNKRYKKHSVSQNEFLDNTSYAFNITSNKEAKELLNAIDQNSELLGDIVIIHAGGIATGSDKKEMILDYAKNSKYKPMLEGKDIKAFYPEFSDRYILYDRKKLRRAREESIFLSPEKIITQRIGGGKRVIIASYDDKQYYTFNSTNSLLKKNDKYSLKYIVALLNSNLINYYYVNKFTNESTLTVNISKTYLEKLPIKEIDESQQEKFIKLVDEILDLSKHIDKTSNTNSNIEDKKEIDNKKKTIDELVYTLYGLTETQKKLIKKFFGEQTDEN